MNHNFMRVSQRLGMLMVFLALAFNAKASYTLSDEDVEMDTNGYIISCSYSFFDKDIIDKVRKSLFPEEDNDEKTKRAYNSKTDAYRTFKKMLNKGHPPDNWEQLILEAKNEAIRLQKIICKK